MRYIQDAKEVCPTALEKIKYPVFLSIDNPIDFKNMWALLSSILSQKGKFDDSFVAWCQDLYRTLAENSHSYYVVGDPYTH